MQFLASGRSPRAIALEKTFLVEDVSPFSNVSIFHSCIRLDFFSIIDAVPYDLAELSSAVLLSCLVLGS